MQPIERFVGIWFVRIVRRWPIVFLLFALTGEVVGSVCLLAGDEWPILLLGGLMMLFYTGMLVLVGVKLYRGTWAASCDWAEALIDKNEMQFGISAEKRARGCPNCGVPLGNRKRGRRTWTQALWGGWTCPDCGCDLDFDGNRRARKIAPERGGD